MEKIARISMIFIITIIKYKIKYKIDSILTTIS